MATGKAPAGQAEQSDGPSPGALAARRWGLRAVEWAFIAVVARLAFAWRMLPFANLAPEVAEGATRHVYYIGTDPYYHWRVILATVANFPETVRFDPFTFFPNGTGTGQFGSLFDQGAALLAIALGKTDRFGVAEVTAMYPAVVGALLFIPFYYLARALVGRIGAAFATVTLLLLPGEFLVRSLAGYADHHVAEAFGMIVALLGSFVALEVAAKNQAALVWPRTPEQRKALMWPVGAVVLGAVGVIAYFLVWPPAILVVGIMAIVLAVTLFHDHWLGRDTTYIAFAGGGTFLLAGVLLLPTAEVPQLNFNTFSFLQPVACLLTGGTVVLLHVAGRALATRKLHPGVLPGATLGAGLVSFLGLRFLMPGLYGALAWGASWVTGIGVKRETLTIAEAQPIKWGDLTADLGLPASVFAIALLGMVIMIVWKRRRADLLMLIWSLLMLRATLTQVRFSYYFALVVAIATGWFAYQLADLTGFNRALAAVVFPKPKAAPQKTKGKGSRGRRAPDETEARFTWYQPLAVAAVGLLLLPGLVIAEKDSTGAEGPDGKPLRGDDCSARVSLRPAWALGKCFGGPDPNLFLWVQSLDWLRENTPDAGLDITTLYDRPPSGERFAYPDSAYGVLSWWDYGHWIEVEGERPPVANPFQQAAPFASCWLMASNEPRAEELLLSWRAQTFARPGDAACHTIDLPAVTADPGNNVRYVMIDDEMAAGKFGAITVWAKLDDFPSASEKTFRSADGRELELPWLGQAYYDSMLVRLYVDDAEGLEHYRLVHETQASSVIANVIRLDGENARIVRFNDVLGRDNRDQSDFDFFRASGRTQLIPINDQEFAYDARLAAAVKTFERVAGAEIAGSGVPPNSAIKLSVPLTSDTTGRSWSWSTSTTSDATGAFTLRVPYATNSYVAPADGGTNLTVRATGPAVLQVGTLGELDVPISDRAVLDGSTIEVSLAGT